MCTNMHYRLDYKTQVTVLPSRSNIPTLQYQYRVIEAKLGKFISLVEIGVLALKDP